MGMDRQEHTEPVYAPGRYGIDPEADRPRVKMFEPLTPFKIYFIYIPALWGLWHLVTGH